MGRMIDEHMESMKQVMMLPVSSLVESFPGMVREISGKLGKSVKLIITGSELEIDKRILEDLKVPLIHLLRNCIDHGIVRVRNGSGLQVASGTIRLDFATHENSHIEIKVSDDGDGINTKSLIKSAIKSGILSEADALKIERKDAINLIFQSGLSTSQIITEISGHGLGMSIVREKISKINGTISIDSETGRGTTFTIVVPMSMATFRGISVRLNESIFILPSANVEKVLITPLDQIKTVENHDTISLADSIIPVVDLKEILGLSNIHEMAKGNSSIATDQSDKVNLIVVTADEKKAAFRVNEVSGEQQVLVKGLGALMPHVRNISGATILGNGKVVPILNPYDLLLSAKNGVVRRNLETSEVKQVEKSGRILVVEDSITSRTMLKNVLETAGYTVTTAVDGIDGYTKAKSESFDLIMSDVDMPRLNGFELTTRIRSDKNLSQMPVILLTSLDSREDREYGIEVGADAYMVKSSFDQGNLINVIHKLI
jgi:two-component system chemotaxis sensor kinase CheA